MTLWRNKSVVVTGAAGFTGGESHDTSDTLDVMYGIADCTPAVIRQVAQHGARDTWADRMRARSLLDCAPLTSLEEG